MRKRLVAGNWKMHGSLVGNRALLAVLRAAHPASSGLAVAVCVPFPYLVQVQEELSGSGVDWGAQNLSEHAGGAYTGEVSAAMLGEFGCRYAIVGHSERRALYGESDAQVAAKFAAASVAGLVPILCVGETLAEREAGETRKVVARQLAAVLDRNDVAAFAAGVIAYEPVWAIGTGRTASPAQTQEVHAYIRGLVAAQDGDVAGKLPILYGGSVKPGNARELFAQPDVDGGLIGGASLVVEDFLGICRTASD
jgi:triosephosphate isomerase